MRSLGLTHIHKPQTMRHTIMSDRKIGMLLAQRGVLSHEEVDAILERQRAVRQPFGKIACEQFGIAEQDVWSAWAEQVGYFCQRVDLACEPNDESVLDLVTAHEAWSGHLLPLRRDSGELVAATTITDLPQAMGLLQQRLGAGQPVRFVIPERRQLEQFIIRRYQIVSIEYESA
jgi:hypothetical protein